MFQIARHIARKFLPPKIRKPIADHVYYLLLRYYQFIYGIPYFSKAIHNLNDRKYKKIFYHYGKRLTKETSQVERSGAVFMIGTLGPGGAERQTVLTLTHLKQQRISPLLMVPFYLDTTTEQFYLTHLLKEQITVNPLKEYKNETVNDSVQSAELMNAAQFLPYSLRSDVKSCIQVFLKHRPKIVHLWLDETNIKGGLAAVAARVPKIILSTRNLPPTYFAFYQPYMREGYRWLLQHPNVTLLNNSKAGAQEYEQWLGLKPGSITVIHNGFNFDTEKLLNYRNNRQAYRLKHNIPLDIPLIGTVMRFNDEKRPTFWVKIAACIRELLPEAQFLMVGDGPLRKKVERKKKNLKLEQVLHCVGNEQDVFAAMAGMDLFLLTSRVEGLPNVLIEAQTLGVPVITTNAGGAAETLEHGQSGWVLDSEKPEEIAKIIVKLLSDKIWYDKASHYASQFTQRSFPVEKMMSLTLQAYNIAK